MLFRRTTIYQHEKGLRFSDGKFVAVVEPGTYRLFGKSEKISGFDLRERQHLIGGQEVLTSDSATVRITLLMTCRIADPYLYYQTIPVDLDSRMFSGAEGINFLQNQIQVMMRDWVASRILEKVLDEKNVLPEAILPVVEDLAVSHGLEVTAIQLMNFAIAGSLKSAQTDILKAELEGKAAMQRARNEASTLRSLINTAKLTQENPGLLELRILSSGQKPRVTFMIGSQEAPKSSVVESQES